MGGERHICRPLQPGLPQGDSQICQPEGQRKADYNPGLSPNMKTSVNLMIDMISTSTYYSRELTITAPPIVVWR
jgi:hypothetical protein